MKKVTLAFYKGKGTWIDWCIRFATRSKYSHVEIILDYPEFPNGQTVFDCFSSSARDGGVRTKTILLTKENWDIQIIRWSPEFPDNFITTMTGARYDFWGVLLSQGFNFARHSKARWFCSEICAALIGLNKAHTYSPGRLNEAIDMMNRTYFLGIQQSHNEVLELNRKSPGNRRANWNPKKPKG